MKHGWAILSCTALLVVAVGCGDRQREVATLQPPTARHRAIMDLEETPSIEPTYREELEFGSIQTVSGFKGTIVIRVVIGADGVPKQATLAHGMVQALDERALEAAKKWRWPPLLHFKQLTCMVTFVVNACKPNGPCTDLDGDAEL